MKRESRLPCQAMFDKPETPDLGIKKYAANGIHCYCIYCAEILMGLETTSEIAHFI